MTFYNLTFAAFIIVCIAMGAVSWWASNKLNKIKP